MSIPLRLDPAARDRSHKLYLAACVLGMAASILQPWYLPSCLLFALTALVLAVVSYVLSLVIVYGTMLVATAVGAV